MTLEEAKAWRASLAKPASAKPLSQKQKRDAFKVYWTQNKKKYGMTGKLEHVLWLHLVAPKTTNQLILKLDLKISALKKFNREKIKCLKD